MAAPKRKKPSRVKPVWERGYNAHGYWKGKEKLGTVKLGAKGEWDGIYRWQAGNHYGGAATLAEAKRAVEQAVLVGASQLGLFGEDDAS